MTPMFTGEAIFETITLSRKIQPKADAVGWDLGDVLAKCTEELGEFSEAIQIKRGKMPHKEAVHNADVDEAADVLICVLDALARSYPDKPPSELHTMLSSALIKKGAKWESYYD